MKKIVSVILALVLLLSLAACSGGAENDSSSVSREGTGAVKTVEEKTGDKTAETLETKSDSGTTVRISKPVTIKKELDGVTLTVMLEKTKIKVGEDLKLTAKVTNNSGKTIETWLPTSTENAHVEIEVKVQAKDGRIFFDVDTYDKWANNLSKKIALEDGKSITQEMTFVPGILDSKTSKAEYYPAGKYSGTAVFNWGANDKYENEKNLKIEFEVEIV